MAARVKRSGVWEYFVLQVTDDSKVSCSLCNAVISRGGKDTKNFNTSNMRYHLETKHPDEYKQLAAKEKELSKEKVGGSNQPTFSNHDFDILYDYKFIIITSLLTSYIMINIGYRYLYRYRQYVLLIIGIISYRHFTLSVEHYNGY